MLSFTFPPVQGFEDINSILSTHPSENMFGALIHAYPLKPIANDKSARNGERMLEYLGRAFDPEIPVEIKNYHHVLSMQMKEYDDLYHVRAAEDMQPHEFLKALLIEDQLTQKSLVPDCFATESQVSEFLHQKKGREKLSYQQAALLGKKFHVDPLNFL